MKIQERNTSLAHGYTLMEMMLVLAIIALLLGTGAFVMKGVTEGGDQFKADADISTLHASLIRYKTAGRRYPTESQGLESLYHRPTDGPPPANWLRYIEKSLLTDPWGNPYQYRYPAARNAGGSYDIFSFGPDGMDRTADDIGNWEDE